MTDPNKNTELLPTKETALENIEASMNMYDMPEHQDTLAVEGWALSELVDEVKRWRATHSAGEFNPDYCSASEALAEHLEHCARPAPVQDGGDVLTIFNAAQIDEDMWQFDEAEISIIRHSLTPSTGTEGGGEVVNGADEFGKLEDAWSKIKNQIQDTGEFTDAAAINMQIALDAWAKAYNAATPPATKPETVIGIFVTVWYLFKDWSYKR